MNRETQAELFIRTLADLLSDLRVHQMARLRDLHKADAERFMMAFGNHAHNGAHLARTSVWRGPSTQGASRHSYDA